MPAITSANPRLPEAIAISDEVRGPTDVPTIAPGIARERAHERTTAIAHNADRQTSRNLPQRLVRTTSQFTTPPRVQKEV